MKIIIIGGTGTIGQAVANALQARHECLIVGHASGDYQVDIEDIDSIRNLFQAVGAFDALVVAAGRVHFENALEMSDPLYRIGLNSKLMGSINCVLEALPFIKDNGSITLTSGIINRSPIAKGSSAAMVNGAIDAFVKAMAIELQRGLRINAVSPTVIEESMPAYEQYFRGYKPISAQEAALRYIKSIEGLQTGEVFCAE